MKTLLKITLFFLFVSCKAQSHTTTTLQLDTLNGKINKLIKKNDSLQQKVNEFKIASNSSVEVIDKIDNLYNNNFNRFIVFWAIVASLIIIGIPYYITRMQNKILEAKKTEIFNYSKSEITKLEEKFTSELKEKYIELNDLINITTENSKENLRKEFIKSHIVNLYIASKINEIDKKHDNVFSNLSNAVIRSNSIEYYHGVKFHLNNILTSLTKFRNEGIVLNTEKLKEIGKKLEVLRDIEEIDQDLLEKVIDELQ